MTVFDLELMSSYRSRNPSLEQMVEGIAIFVGAMKPPAERGAEMAQAAGYSTKSSRVPPDPREAIRAAFGGKILDPELGHAVNVL